MFSRLIAPLAELESAADIARVAAADTSDHQTSSSSSSSSSSSLSSSGSQCKLTDLSLSQSKERLSQYYSRLLDGKSDVIMGLGVEAGCLLSDKSRTSLSSSSFSSSSSSKSGAAAPPALAAAANIQPVEIFLPRRMAFAFAVNDSEPEHEYSVPTTLIRSKADCPPRQVLETSY